MEKQKPPNATGEITGFPYSDCWEEFGETGQPLYADGSERVIIERSLDWAQEQGAMHLWLGNEELKDLLEPLNLRADRRSKLAESLYYLAGHYLAPKIRKLRGDSPAEVRKMMRRISKAAAKFDELMSGLSPGVQRHLRGARWMLGTEQRKGDPEVAWRDLQYQLVDLANSAKTVAEEFPRFKRGTTMKVLRGRWLRQSAAAIEEAVGVKIDTVIGDSTGRNYRFQGLEGQVFETYCRRVDKGITPKPMVQAVRDLHDLGVAGRQF